MAIKLRNKNKITRKKLYIIIALFACLLIGSVGVYALSNSNDTNVGQDDKNTSNKSDRDATNSEVNQESAELNNEEPASSIDDPDQKIHSTNTDTPPPVEEPEEGSKVQVMMSIFHDINSSHLNIRGGIDNAVVFDGQCYITLTGPSNENITRDTPLLQNPRTTDCQTISVPRESLTKGQWTAQLHYQSNTHEGKSNEISIEIK